MSKRSVPSDEFLAFHDDNVEALSIIKALAGQRKFNLGDLPSISADKGQNVSRITQFFELLNAKVSARFSEESARGLYQSKTEEYTALFAKIPMYEFSDQDFNRIQVLINELRTEITKSTLIAENHKRRLLKRLEAMQAELHKRTSDIDRFWGFIGEAGITMRKFGQDIEPITNRVQELGRIVIAVIFTAEGIKALPEISKILLPGN